MELDKSIEGGPTCLHSLLSARLQLSSLIVPGTDEHSTSTMQDGANYSKIAQGVSVSYG